MENMIKENVVIIGMPGSGKSEIGKLLAKELNYEFCDMDVYIKNISGKSIAELFKQGEDCFRSWESRACIELSKKRRLVIASGGGVIKRSCNIDVLREKGLILFLNRPTENILSDLDTDSRPLLKDGKEKIYNLYNERFELYNNSADIEILNDGFLKDIVMLAKKSIEGKILK